MRFGHLNCPRTLIRVRMRNCRRPNLSLEQRAYEPVRLHGNNLTCKAIDDVLGGAADKHALQTRSCDSTHNDSIGPSVTALLFNDGLGPSAYLTWYQSNAGTYGSPSLSEEKIHRLFPGFWDFVYIVIPQQAFVCGIRKGPDHAFPDRVPRVEHDDFCITGNGNRRRGRDDAPVQCVQGLGLGRVLGVQIDCRENAFGRFCRRLRQQPYRAGAFSQQVLIRACEQKTVQTRQRLGHLEHEIALRFRNMPDVCEIGFTSHYGQGSRTGWHDLGDLGRERLPCHLHSLANQLIRSLT